jgi:hypothetical protein
MFSVKRDPFARGEYKRFVQSNRSHVSNAWSCDWCGQKPDRLYSYVWWGDAKKEPQDDSGYWFCNLNCFQAYP